MFLIPSACLSNLLLIKCMLCDQSLSTLCQLSVISFLFFPMQKFRKRNALLLMKFGAGLSNVITHHAPTDCEVKKFRKEKYCYQSSSFYYSRIFGYLIYHCYFNFWAISMSSWIPEKLFLGTNFVLYLR